MEELQKWREILHKGESGSVPQNLRAAADHSTKVARRKTLLWAIALIAAITVFAYSVYQKPTIARITVSVVALALMLSEFALAAWMRRGTVRAQGEQVSEYWNLLLRQERSKLRIGRTCLGTFIPMLFLFGIVAFAWLISDNWEPVHSHWLRSTVGPGLYFLLLGAGFFLVRRSVDRQQAKLAALEGMFEDESLATPVAGPSPSSISTADEKRSDLPST